MIWIEFSGRAGREGGGMAFNCNIMNEPTELSFLGGCVLYVQTRLWTLGVSFASSAVGVQVTAPTTPPHQLITFYELLTTLLCSYQ
jgi:hypothetical protein